MLSPAIYLDVHVDVDHDIHDQCADVDVPDPYVDVDVRDYYGVKTFVVLEYCVVVQETCGGQDVCGLLTLCGDHAYGDCGVLNPFFGDQCGASYLDIDGQDVKNGCFHVLTFDAHY